MKERGGAHRSITSSLIGVIQMPSWPSLLLFVREETTELISSADVGESKKQFGFDSDKNCVYDILGLVSFLARLGPMLVKKLLNLEAICSGLV